MEIVSLIGASNSGKSTLTGHLVYKCGHVGHETISKIEQKIAESGLTKFSLLLDMLASQQDRGYGPGVFKPNWIIKTEMKEFELLQCSSFHNFFKNSKDITQSHIALLIIPAPVEEFDECMEENGKFRSNVSLMKFFGIKQVLVCINKMDMGPNSYSEDRYNIIRQEISVLLYELEFEKISFLYQFQPHWVIICLNYLQICYGGRDQQ